jgi:hypothetical protein
VTARPCIGVLSTDPDRMGGGVAAGAAASELEFQRCRPRPALARAVMDRETLLSDEPLNCRIGAAARRDRVQ